MPLMRAGLFFLWALLMRSGSSMALSRISTTTVLRCHVFLVAWFLPLNRINLVVLGPEPSVPK